MGFLAPITAAIAAAVVIPALVALYFLKLRRRQVVVPSTLLWKKAIQDMQVNAPFQRLRKNLLLLLQLLLLAALLLAMARPTMNSMTAPGQRVVILIDHSASMNATDGNTSGDSRLDEAKRVALELIDAIGAEHGGGSADAVDASGGAMVVSFAERAVSVQPLTGDLPLLRDAVRRIEPTDQRSNLAAALRLVEPLALEADAAGGATGLVVYVLSDGQAHPSGEPLALKGAELRYLPMGSRSNASDARGNLGIVSFSARRDLEKPQMVQVFARLANYGSAAVTTNVTLRIDGEVQRVQKVTVGAASSGPASTQASPGAEGGEAGASAAAVGGAGVQGLQFDFVLPGAGVVAIEHDHEDVLTSDDVARLVLAPARRLRVLMVTGGNAFLQRVIQSVGVRELVTMTPDKYENQDPQTLRRGGWDTAGTTANVNEGFDLVVFDSYTPKAVPPVSSLSFGASVPVEGLRIVSGGPASTQASEGAEGGAQAAGESGGAEVILDWDRDHPLMRYVVLDDVILQRPGRLVVPNEATVLATGQSGPIVAELVREGKRHVVTSFDVIASNWPLYVSFPVFMSNAVQTLGLGGLADEAGLQYATGEVAVIPVETPGATLGYAGPVDLEARSVGGEAVLGPFSRVGLYQATGDVEPPFDRLAVNVLDPLESDVRPADRLEVGTESVQGQAQSKAVRREVWHWFAWAALALLAIEWLVYTRRMHL